MEEKLAGKKQKNPRLLKIGYQIPGIELKKWYPIGILFCKRQVRKSVDRPRHEKTAHLNNLLKVNGFEPKKWWS